MAGKDINYFFTFLNSLLSFNHFDQLSRTFSFFFKLRNKIWNSVMYAIIYCMRKYLILHMTTVAY